MLAKDEDQGAHTLSTKVGGAPTPTGRAPCLVGPLLLRRPQLQLHIFRLSERKNQRGSFIAFYDTEPPPSPNLSREG